MRRKGSLQQITRINTDKSMRNWGNMPAIFSSSGDILNSKTTTALVAWKAVHDWRCTALQAVVGIGAISPEHPRFTRMYGVTNSTVFQTVLNKRFFYDRRELFCLRILSFRSGSCWVRLIFLGSPKGLSEKRRTRISWDLP